MIELQHTELPIANARSLVWRDDALTDFIGGAAVYRLDGTQSARRYNYAYRFDAVTTSPSGAYSVLYERRGTKGVVLRGDHIIREINRSFYHAGAYDFPIALFQLDDGREAVIHCPTDYNRLDIELLETGERLTARPAEQAADFFHSGLSVDPTCAWIMSAGWIWHPCHSVRFFKLDDVLEFPDLLDKGAWPDHLGAEVGSAVFLDAERVVLAADADTEPFDHDAGPEELSPGTLAVYHHVSGEWESRVPLRSPVGRMLAVDDEHVLALHGHPKLISLATGETVNQWPDISSGLWTDCIRRLETPEPPLAWDPIKKRLAVGAPDRIHLLTAEP